MPDPVAEARKGVEKLSTSPKDFPQKLCASGDVRKSDYRQYVTINNNMDLIRIVVYNEKDEGAGEGYGTIISKKNSRSFSYFRAAHAGFIVAVRYLQGVVHFNGNRA